MKNLNREQQIEIQKYLQQFEKRKNAVVAALNKGDLQQVYFQLNLDAINSNKMSDKIKDIYESRK